MEPDERIKELEETIKGDVRRIQTLEDEGGSYRDRISQLESSIERFQNRIDDQGHTIRTQGDIIRNQLTELEEFKNKAFPQTAAIGRSHEEKPDIIFHQQNNPSNIVPSHLACGKKIDGENVPVFEREKVTCKNCLSKADPHVRY